MKTKVEAYLSESRLSPAQKRYLDGREHITIYYYVNDVIKHAYIYKKDYEGRQRYSDAQPNTYQCYEHSAEERAAHDFYRLMRGVDPLADLMESNTKEPPSIFDALIASTDLVDLYSYEVFVPNVIDQFYKFPEGNKRLVFDKASTEGNTVIRDFIGAYLDEWAVGGYNPIPETYREFKARYKQKIKQLVSTFDPWELENDFQTKRDYKELMQELAACEHSELLAAMNSKYFAVGAYYASGLNPGVFGYRNRDDMPQQQRKYLEIAESLYDYKPAHA